MGGVEREFDVLGGRAGDGANDIAVNRRNIIKRLALDRGDPLAADIIVVMRPDRDLIGDLRENFVDHLLTP